MTATIHDLRPASTPAAPEPFDFTAHARLLVEVFGYEARDVPDLCPLATPETQVTLALAMAAVTAESAPWTS